MKKILFVLQSPQSGGSTTSMLNLIGFLDKDKVKADIFFLERNGTFLEKAKELADVLPEERIVSSITCKVEDLKKRGIISGLIRLVYVFVHKIFGKERAFEIFYAKSVKRLPKDYDAVIAYQEAKVTEYLKTYKGTQRIAWVHCDYDRFKLNHTEQFEQNLYNHYDDIVCVSEYAKTTMKENLNLDDDHLHVIYNTIDVQKIRALASEQIQIKTGKITFVSVGRFVPIKAFDRAVEVAELLKKDGIEFVWHLIGDGEDLPKVMDCVRQKKLEDCIIFHGNQKNPYQYMKQADYYICTSICETHPMVALEALALGLPVISTSYPSTSEVILDGYNGVIVPNTSIGIYQGIKKVLGDKEFSNAIHEKVHDYVYDNQKSVNTFYKVLNIN